MELDTENVYLLLGSNLGDRNALINDAIQLIEQRVGPVFKRSSLYETAAWGLQEQPAFLNVAVGVSTTLSPLEVLQEVLDIESVLGRIRHEKWGARLIDIDIILYGNAIVDLGTRLQIPHPQMEYRKFVLEPLAEIAGTYVHPQLKLNLLEILKRLSDNLSVSKV